MVRSKPNTVNNSLPPFGGEPEGGADLLTLLDQALDEFSRRGQQHADTHLAILIEALTQVCRLTHDSVARSDFEVRYQAFVIAARALDQVGGPCFHLSPAIATQGRHPAFREVLSR